jgi:hypothetical protein
MLLLLIITIKTKLQQYLLNYTSKRKGKAIPLTGREGP